jgi:hypothetical protein
MIKRHLYLDHFNEIDVNGFVRLLQSLELDLGLFDNQKQVHPELYLGLKDNIKSNSYSGTVIS